MSLLRWTTKLLLNRAAALSEKGHRSWKPALANVLDSLVFSLKAHKKNIEVASHIVRRRPVPAYWRKL